MACRAHSEPPSFDSQNLLKPYDNWNIISLSSNTWRLTCLKPLVQTFKSHAFLSVYRNFPNRTLFLRVVKPIEHLKPIGFRENLMNTIRFTEKKAGFGVTKSNPPWTRNKLTQGEKPRIEARKRRHLGPKLGWPWKPMKCGGVLSHGGK